jgi:hypothetical protein
VLDEHDPLINVISEAWLKRLENGLTVKISRSIIEALCEALRCTARERAHILLHADRSVLIDADEPSVAAETLNYVMYRLFTEASDILNQLIKEKRVNELDEQEMFEIVKAALELVAEQRHRSRLQ